MAVTAESGSSCPPECLRPPTTIVKGTSNTTVSNNRCSSQVNFCDSSQGKSAKEIMTDLEPRKDPGIKHGFQSNLRLPISGESTSENESRHFTHSLHAAPVAQPPLFSTAYEKVLAHDADWLSTMVVKALVAGVSVHHVRQDASVVSMVVSCCSSTISKSHRLHISLWKHLCLPPKLVPPEMYARCGKFRHSCYSRGLLRG